MKQTKAEKAEDKAEGLTYLRKHLKKGDTIYTILCHVSRSGMYRVISLYTFKQGKVTWITKYAAWAMVSRWDDKHEGIGVGGCGSDVGFDTVMNLSYALHGNKTSRCKCTKGSIRDGFNICCHRPGYTLKHEWL